MDLGIELRDFVWSAGSIVLSAMWMQCTAEFNSNSTPI